MSSSRGIEPSDEESRQSRGAGGHQHTRHDERQMWRGLRNAGEIQALEQHRQCADKCKCKYNHDPGDERADVRGRPSVSLRARSSGYHANGIGQANGTQMIMPGSIGSQATEGAGILSGKRLQTVSDYLTNSRVVGYSETTKPLVNS